VTICDRCREDHDEIPFRRVLACIHGIPQAEADVYTERIADRLAGYSHDEVVAMHPLPADEETKP
jgi:predicted transcriptional regulator